MASGTSPYEQLVLRNYCGSTPDFPGARVSIECRAAYPAAQRERLLAASRQLAERLAGAHPGLAQLAWIRPEAGEEPLAAWVSALLSACGLPDYPRAVVAGPEDGTLRIDYGIPYPDAVRLATDVALQLLRLAADAMAGGGVRVKLAPLQEALQALRRTLPSPELMAWHARLGEGGALWQWLGGDRTRIGMGARQRICAGVEAPDTAAAREIPIYTVTGSVGKTTTVRLLGQLLASSGRRIGLAASDGAWVGGERRLDGDCIGGVSALALLRDPAVEVAVLEQGRGGLLRQGIPYARSDVAVLLNVREVHLGLDGIDSIEQMADLKALGLACARLAVLNLDDAQCLRLGEARPDDTCVWFSRVAGDAELLERSRRAAGVVGVVRDQAGDPLSLSIWRNGRQVAALSLQGVAPYHGFLGEKTLEELLAAVSAAWFGPLPLAGWDERLAALRLDSENHLFRSSLHRAGNVCFVLDKAAESASLESLGEVLQAIVRRERVDRVIGVITRAAGEHPDRHRESVAWAHGLIDELLCFDRPDTYTTKVALPCYAPGSIPGLLAEEWCRLNAERGEAKPVEVFPDWDAVQAYLQQRLTQRDERCLVLINQPSTNVFELNRRIVDFVLAWPRPAG